MLHSGCVKLHQKFRDFVGLPMGLLREESPKNRMNTGLFGSRSGEYGFNPKHRQKYRCKNWRSVFMATSGTMFTHSRTSFNTWSTFIVGELNGLTLEQQAVATEMSIVTCFNMRHKLYKAITRFVL